LAEPFPGSEALRRPVNAECTCDCGVEEEHKLMRELTD